VLFAGGAYDPSAAPDGAVAWQRPGGVALLRRPGEIDRVLPGTHPACGNGLIAWREGEEVVLADRGSLRVQARIGAPGAGVIAISGGLLAWRARDAQGTDRLWIRPFEGGAPRLLLESPAPVELGRPVLGPGLLICHSAGPLGSRLLAVETATGSWRVLREEPGAQLSNPAADGARLLYVHATGRTQELRLGALAPAPTDADAVPATYPSPGRRDSERERGKRRHRHRNRLPLPPRAEPGVVETLWSTALGPDAAYVTRLRAGRGGIRTADVLRVPIAPVG
jgi:hypothetical protein